MAHEGEGGAGDGILARRQARAEKDRLKAGFGARLKVLLDLTGLSSREFAARFPAYKDSTVRKYTLGTNLPPWDFLNDLLTEVARRTDDPAAPQRRTELFTAYRTVLIDTGANLHGSDQNSLLLRLLDGEEALHRLRDELAEVRGQENQLRLDLEEETRRAQAAPGTGGEERRRRLEEESRALAARRDDLVHRRGALVTELDECRARLAVMEATDSADLVPAGTGGGAGAHQASVPPPPPGPPTASPAPPQPGRRRALLLIGAAVAVVLLAGGGAAAGIWATGGNDPDNRAAPPSPQAPAPPVTGPATPTPTTVAPAPSASSSAEPGADAEPSPDVEPTGDNPAPAEYTSSPSGTSLVNDLPAFEDDGYQAGAQSVNLHEFPVALREDANSCQTVATWQLDRTYKRLVAGIGISDESSTGSSKDFTISVDGHVQFQRSIGVGESAQTAVADLTGAYRVTLMIQSCDSAVGSWLDPVITK
ncbi:NPCBM/NEW2 domain-containing protein [Streptomyces sp. NPDC008125]|uniref:NPCBM/NEW2 domain-containing protein n=1 Tax=Streptomyces sp. NPDC008125 TaxID=3364811 RepID=UPI0036F08C0D